MNQQNFLSASLGRFRALVLILTPAFMAPLRWLAWLLPLCVLAGKQTLPSIQDDTTSVTDEHLCLVCQCALE